MSDPRAGSVSMAVKPSRYNHTAPALIPGRTLVFNGMTGTLLELSAREAARARPWLEGAPAPAGDPLVQRLTEAGCLVPAGRDELEVIRTWRTANSARGASAPLSLTIAPTMQCNFRCTYCFEEHRHEFMGAEVEAAVRAFVSRKVEEGAPAIGVTWFGGEPMLHVACIERLQGAFNALAEARGLKTSRAMITNGYLLTADRLDRLHALGEWDYLQVTLDGPPDAHDRSRPLVGGQGTWERIVANLRTALDHGFVLSLRMNTGRRNVARIRDTVTSLLAAGVLPRGRLYLGRLFDCTPQSAHVKSEMLTHAEFAEAQLQLQQALLDAGLPSGVRLPRPRPGPLCTADDRNGFVIAPSGLLFKCWNEVHMSAEHSIGNLVGDVHRRAAENLASWQGHDVLGHEACRGCRALPTCLSGCPWMARQPGADRGNCGQYRSLPDEVIQIAHAERAAQAGIADQPVAR